MSGLVKQLLMICREDAFVEQVNDSGELALQALYERKMLIHARFVYEDSRTNIPFLVQEDGRRTLYFTCHSCSLKEHEAVRTAQHLAVLGKLGTSIDAAYAIHLDAAYVRGKELDVRQLLIVDEYLYNGKNKAHKTIRGLLDKQEIGLDTMLEELHACKAMDDIPVKRSRACIRGSKCMYYDDCPPEMPADDSILSLVQATQKYEMREKGITAL